MNFQEKWRKLLLPLRYGGSGVDFKKLDPARSPFLQDRDRIIYSSSFRRLARKTQVHPLVRNDHIHTRLSHSLEVSSVGRSLGAMAGYFLRRRDELPEYAAPEFPGQILEAACLAHDIGNPPFGHSGEDAIETALKRHGLEMPFEGNAQGFRILTRTGDPMEGNGLKLTAAVLGAFMKYPCTQSYSAAVRKGGMTAANKLECKKFGIGEQEREAASFVAGHLGLLPRSAPDEKYLCWCRHPLAYLMEAADDICYRIADIEDGHFSGILDFEPTRDLFSPFLTESQLCYVRELEKKDEKDSCIHYMRALAIGRSIQSAVDSFMKHEEELLQGSMDQSLIDRSELAGPLNGLYRYAIENVYQAREVIEVEAMGYKVLGELIDFFMEWVNHPSSGQSKKVAIMLQGTGLPKDDEGKDARLAHMLDYISGMTDSFALETYRKLTGIL